MKRLLSVREEQVLVLICEGFTYREIALLMDKSPNTIKEINRRIRLKTDCHKIAHMVVYAIVNRIVSARKLLALRS